MSIRTIVEINHDYLRELSNAEVMAELRRHLSSASRPEDWNDTYSPVVRVIAQRHHSEELTVKIK